jgi:hypothetical protein
VGKNNVLAIRTIAMVMLLGVLGGAELHRDGVGLQGVLGLDADEEGAAAAGGHALAGEEGRLEAAGERALQLKSILRLGINVVIMIFIGFWSISLQTNVMINFLSYVS